MSKVPGEVVVRTSTRARWLGVPALSLFGAICLTPVVMAIRQGSWELYPGKESIGGLVFGWCVLGGFIAAILIAIPNMLMYKAVFTTDRIIVRRPFRRYEISLDEATGIHGYIRRQPNYLNPFRPRRSTPLTIYASQDLRKGVVSLDPLDHNAKKALGVLDEWVRRRPELPIDRPARELFISRGALDSGPHPVSGRRDSGLTGPPPPSPAQHINDLNRVPSIAGRGDGRLAGFGTTLRHEGGTSTLPGEVVVRMSTGARWVAATVLPLIGAALLSPAVEAIRHRAWDWPFRGQGMPAGGMVFVWCMLGAFVAATLIPIPILLMYKAVFTTDRIIARRFLRRSEISLDEAAGIRSRNAGSLLICAGEGIHLRVVGLASEFKNAEEALSVLDEWVRRRPELPIDTPTRELFMSRGVLSPQPQASSPSP
jgi:hypothetical protein